MDTVKERILKCFEKNRQRPDWPFEESHFLDFLTFPPAKKKTASYSFKASGKYYRFMQCIELEFGICLSLADTDRNYSVDSLVKKVEDRLTKSRGNLIILKNRNAEKPKYLFEIFASILLSCTYFRFGINWVSITLTLLLTLSSCFIFYTRKSFKKHNSALAKRILEIHG